MSKSNLLLEAAQLPHTWRSTVIGHAAGVNLKVLRMDDLPYPDETHDFDEALLVLDGQMNLQIRNELITVKQGEVFIVPAGVSHAVAPGSRGTLVIIDR